MHVIPRRYEADVQTMYSTHQSGVYRFSPRHAAAKHDLWAGGHRLDDVVRHDFGGGGRRGCGLLMIVPMLGGPLSLFLPLLIGLLQSPRRITGWLLLLLIVFQVVLFNVITPRLLSRALQMPSLLVIVSLLIGTQLIGVWGFFFAVPDRGRVVFGGECAACSGPSAIKISSDLKVAEEQALD